PPTDATPPCPTPTARSGPGHHRPHRPRWPGPCPGTPQRRRASRVSTAVRDPPAGGLRGADRARVGPLLERGRGRPALDFHAAGRRPVLGRLSGHRAGRTRELDRPRLRILCVDVVRGTWPRCNRDRRACVHGAATTLV